jgi:hypothetical protein
MEWHHRDVDLSAEEEEKLAREEAREEAAMGGRRAAPDCYNGSGDDTAEVSVRVSSRFTSLGPRARWMSW